jgi:hypothetical protein
MTGAVAGQTPRHHTNAAAACSTSVPTPSARRCPPRRARVASRLAGTFFVSGYAEEQLRKTIDIENVALIPKPLSVVQLAEAASNGSAHLIDRVRQR